MMYLCLITAVTEKVSGKIHSEQQFYADAQTAYDSVKIAYPENT